MRPKRYTLEMIMSYCEKLVLTPGGIPSRQRGFNTAPVSLVLQVIVISSPFFFIPIENGPVEIVLPLKIDGSYHSYVDVYQRVPRPSFSTDQGMLR